ncbi:hypothetical protein D3C72_1545140 [compost metagenome]
MFAGIAQHRTFFIRFRQGSGFSPQLLRQPQRPQDRPALIFRQAVQFRCFYIHRVPVATQSGRQPRRDTHQFLIAAAMPHAQQNAVASVPYALAALSIAKGAHLVINPVGGAAQRQFAQRDQIALAEKVLDGALGLAGNVHLAFI